MGQDCFLIPDHTITHSYIKHLTAEQNLNLIFALRLYRNIHVCFGAVQTPIVNHIQTTQKDV